MQVANNTQALKEHLHKRYKTQIDVVLASADARVNEIQQQSEQDARREENRIMIDAKTQSSMKQKAQIALARNSAREDVQTALAELTREVMELIRAQYYEMSNADKKAYLEQLQANVQEQADKHNEEFDIEVDTEELRVIATSQSLIIEESFEQRLREHRDEITKQIKEHVL